MKPSAPMAFPCEGNCGRELRASQLFTMRDERGGPSKSLCPECAGNACRAPESSPQSNESPTEATK